MKKLKSDEIGYSISGAFLNTLMVGALLESIFNLKGHVTVIAGVGTFLTTFLILIYMNMSGEK